MTFKERLGLILKRTREHRELSLKDVAEQLKEIVYQKTGFLLLKLESLENGTDAASIDLLHSVAQIIGCPLSDMINLVEETYTQKNHSDDKSKVCPVRATQTRRPGPQKIEETQRASLKGEINDA